MMTLKHMFFSLLFCVFGSIVCYDYEQHVASHPDDYRALYNAGVTAFKENKLERAQECFDFLKSQDFSKNQTQGEQIFYNAGNTEVKLQKYEDALASFKKVLTFNPDHELARKKIEHIKALLEQQKQEEQENEQQDQKEKNKDKQDQSEKDQDQKDEKSEKQDEKEKDTNESKDSQKSQEQQDQGQNEKQEQQSNDEKDLTEQEKQLLAYVQNHDEKMHEHMDKKKLQKAQGAMNVRNNW